MDVYVYLKTNWTYSNRCGDLDQMLTYIIHIPRRQETLAVRGPRSVLIEEVHTYIPVANIGVSSIPYRKSREGAATTPPPFGGRVTKNTSGERVLYHHINSGPILLLRKSGPLEFEYRALSHVSFDIQGPYSLANNKTRKCLIEVTLVEWKISTL